MSISELLTADEVVAADNGVTEEEILEHLFGKTNGEGLWRQCGYHSAARVTPDGTYAPLQCTDEATKETTMVDRGKRLQVWMCKEHSNALSNTLFYAWCDHLGGFSEA